jgi:NAD(P) transhydrogenase subunit alpha
MRIHVPREIRTGERRVAATPDTVLRLVKLGFTVGIESGAGVEAGFTDAAYVEAGAEIVPDAWVGAGLVTKVNPPLPEEVERLRPDTILVSLLYPAQNQALVECMAALGLTALALDRCRASAARRRWTCCRAWPTSPATGR